MNSKMAMAMAAAAMAAGCIGVNDGGAAATSAAKAKPAAVKAESPSLRPWKMPYKLGVAGFTEFKKSIDETLSDMKRIDMHYLCIKDFHFDYKNWGTKTGMAELKEFKAKCAAAGVTCEGAGPLYYSSEEEARKFFEFAKAYGLKRVVVVPFELSATMKDKKGKPVRVESEKMLDVLEKMVKEYDICAAIHNHGPDIPYLYPTAEAVLKRIANRDRRIGCCLDVGHERRAGLDPVEFIRKHGDRIYDVHLKNIKIDPVRNFAKEGPRGELDIPGILKALAEVGYEGVCHIEYEKDFDDNLAELAESVGYYRGVIDAMSVRVKLEAAPAGANTLSAAEQRDGWKLLWNGKDGTGWLGVKTGLKQFPTKGWVMKDGTLTMRPINGIANGKWFPLPPEDQKLGGGGDIVTVGKYRNFMFKFDFRLTEAGNSGVKYFYDETVNKATCEEYQILENEHPDSTKGTNGNRKTASLYDIIPANADSIMKPAGKWNHGMIVANGSKVEHWLNGVKVIEYERGTAAFKAAVKSSKYATWGVDANGKAQDWGEVAEGRILLQDHSDSTVSFCNLKIKELQ